MCLIGFGMSLLLARCAGMSGANEMGGGERVQSMGTGAHYVRERLEVAHEEAG